MIRFSFFFHHIICAYINLLFFLSPSHLAPFARGGGEEHDAQPGARPDDRRSAETQSGIGVGRQKHETEDCSAVPLVGKGPRQLCFTQTDIGRRRRRATRGQRPNIWRRKAFHTTTAKLGGWWSQPEKRRFRSGFQRGHSCQQARLAVRQRDRAMDLLRLHSNDRGRTECGAEAQDVL